MTILLLLCTDSNLWQIVGGIIVPVATLASAIIAGVGLYWLIGYARDTRKIAQAAIDQIEECGIPYLTISRPSPQSNHQGSSPFAFVNMGKGPAVNIRLEFEIAKMGPEPERRIIGWDPLSRSITDLGVNSEYLIPNPWTISVQQSKPITMKYESLGGRRYKSVYIHSQNGLQETAFERLGG